MKSVFVFLCFLTFSAHAAEDKFQMFPSTFEQIADLSTDEHDLVGDVVSPLSGQLSLRKTDLVAKGAQNVTLDWVYIPSLLAPPPGNPSDSEDAYYKHCNYYGQLFNSYRGWVTFPQCFLKVEGSTALVTTPSGAVLPFNVCQDFCSLQGDPHGMSNAAGEICSGKNDPRNMKISINGDVAILVDSNGTKKTYRRVNYVYFHLVHEVLPNGKVLKYHYSKDPFLLSRVESLDPKERHVYATISFDGASYTTSSGDSASYHRQPREKSGKFKSKKIQADFCFTFPNLIHAISSPTYRDETIEYTDQLALTSYSGKDLIFHCTYNTFGDQNLRVNTLSFPSGTPYTFSYDPPVAGQKPGSATVHRADGVKIVYRFSKNMLLNAVEWFDVHGKLQKTKHLAWDENQRLQSVEWKDGNGKLFYRKTYECDKSGNPVVETISGENHSKTTRRKFTADGRNLLIWEQDPAGKITQIDYVDGTNLPKTKYTLDGDKILIREFWTYDDCLNLIEHSTEDAEVSQRTITRYRLRQAQPFLHMPEWKEELYWDGSQEVLLKKTKFSYDKRGNIASEEIYDANSILAYTISRQFDEQGNLLSETNPLGHKSTSTYDARGNLKTHTNFSGRLEKKLDYDAQSRLRKIAENTHTTTFDYDLLDRCTAKTDYLGNTTRYAYDPITSELCKSVGPSHTTTSTYDPFGRKISSTDPNGNATTYQYNIFGSPTQITYADGSQEHFDYTPIGSLAAHTNLDGLTTHYERDLFDRVTHKKQLDAHETFTYSPFQLLSHRDKEGHETLFTYDGAGRKTSQSTADRTVSWKYDPLGRICLTNHSNLLHIRRTHDHLGQLLEEQKTAPSGEILWQQTYAYDPDGNQTEITTYPHNLPATTRKEFDPFGRLIRTVDPLGNTTTTSYDDTHHTQQIVDPNHITTLITYDPYDRETSRKIGDQFLTTKTYDPAGNLLSLIEGNSLTNYTYDSRNRLKTLTRANERTTTHTYTPSGLLSTKTSADGTSLHYTYSPFGYLQNLTSSDNSIHQTFTHTLNGHLSSATNQHHTLTRTIDPFGNILNEAIDGKTVFTKTYDSLDRVLTITLPDQSSIQYDYQSLLLRAVTRMSADGTPQYTHAYNSYDLAARPLSEILPHNLGKLERTYDNVGRVISIKSPHFAQSITYEPNGRVAAVSSDGVFAYDDLSQITSENSFIYNYDLHRNRVQKNDETVHVNALDEIEDGKTEYDLRGNLIHHSTAMYQYDALNQLVSAKTDESVVEMTYDALGRRRTKTVDGVRELYVHDGTDELFSSDENGVLKELKVCGMGGHPVALEVGWFTYVPSVDFRGNMRKLVNKWGWERETCNYSAFGERLKSSSAVLSPWGYSGKRFDSELGLYYFGKRYYSPALGRWLTTDPLGDIDSTNLYQYALNNPLLYSDLTGQSIGGYLLGLGEIVLGGAIMLGGVALEICTVGGFTIGFMAVEGAGATLIGHGLHLTTQHAQDMSWGKGYSSTRSPNYTPSYQHAPTTLSRKKKGEVDERLPEDPFNDPNLEDVSHPEAKEKGHYQFKDKKTGEIVNYDKGKPGAPGHEAHDHYHRLNPNTTGKFDQYLDAQGNPVPKGSEASHLYPPTRVGWNLH